MLKEIMSRPSGIATAAALFVVVVAFPLALLSGMDVYGALIVNGVLFVIVVPWMWRMTARYRALPTDEARAAETERGRKLNLRNRKFLNVLLAACVIAVLVRLLLLL